MMTKRVRVSTEWIRNTRTGSDSGGNLELYGNLAAQRVQSQGGEFVVVDSQEVFNHPNPYGPDAEDPIDLAENTYHLVNGQPIELTINPGEFLRLTGRLHDYDSTTPDDELTPRDEKTFPYELIPEGGQEVSFADGDLDNAGSQILTARYILDVV